MLYGIEVCGIVNVIPANSGKVAVSGFEGFFKFCLLTSRRLEWYFSFSDAQLNLENQIQQRFQKRAVAITPNPY